MRTTDETGPMAASWWRMVQRLGAELWPRPVPRPVPGDLLEQGQAWNADSLSRGTRTFVVLWFGGVLVTLMLTTFLFAPAPGHQLAAAMLWVTAVGVVARIGGPRLVVRHYEPTVRRRLREFRQAADAKDGS
jgi:hypothetical protein